MKKIHVSQKQWNSQLTIFTEYTQFEDTAVSPSVNAYLYCADDGSSVLIDALQDDPDLYERVSELTDIKKCRVLLSHGHSDHAGVSVKTFLSHGCEVYLNKLDVPFMKLLGTDFDYDAMIDLASINTIPFGDHMLNVIPCPGHTPGSMVFYDAKTGLLFSGDAIGSGGFWMQLPNSLPLHLFYEQAKALYDLVKNDDNLSIMVGHRYQSTQPVTIQYLIDVLEATAKIIDGTLIGREGKMQVAGYDINYCEASYGLVDGYCYDPKNL